MRSMNFFTFLKDDCFYSPLLCTHFAFSAPFAVNTPSLTAESAENAKYTQSKIAKKATG